MLVASGYRVHRVEPQDGGRPLCCGRTYLSAGLVDDARSEARRTVDTLAPYVAKGARVLGLEPVLHLHLPRRDDRDPAQG